MDLFRFKLPSGHFFEYENLGNPKENEGFEVGMGILPDPLIGDFIEIQNNDFVIVGKQYIFKELNEKFLGFRKPTRVVKELHYILDHRETSEM